MSKALSLGNGNILINIGDYAEIRDFYFPYVGLENHIGGHFSHKIGIYVDGKLSWLNDGTWDIEILCEEGTFAGNTKASNGALGISLDITDVVYNEKNVLIRKVRVKNNTDYEREIKVFFNHQFEMYESHSAHTAFYEPVSQTIVHYRNRRCFLVNAMSEGEHFDDYSTGVFGAEGKEGTHMDAEDGILSKNAIEHGQADSVIGLTNRYSAGEEKIIDYWIIVAELIEEAKDINEYVIEKGIAHMIKTTKDYWRAWATRQNFSFYGLSPEIVSLFRKSLFYMRAHTGKNGASIASGDSNMLQKGKDTYAYVWPRDGAISAMAMSMSGDFQNAKKFFEFSRDVITEDGYFMHKYSPDKSLGSSWHPWVRDGVPMPPIQEDETALVLISLGEYYRLSKDLEFIEGVYDKLIRKPAEFMMAYIDKETGLPRESYDLWEEHFGVFTFTASSVSYALIVAGELAGLLGKTNQEILFKNAGEEMKVAVLGHLYDEEKKVFRKMINKEGGRVNYDSTIDISSAHGVSVFNILPADDVELKQVFDNTRDALSCGDSTGIGRYEKDLYYHSDNFCTQNPWIITTLWVTRFKIRSAKTEKDLESVVDDFQWVLDRALSSGVLSEQVDPGTGKQLSVGPLVWSHAEFIIAVVEYLEKLEEFGVCKACNPVY